MQRVDARDDPWSARDTWTRALLTGLAYLATARYVVLLNDPVNLGAGFWPGAGITLGALLISPRRAWPAILTAVGAAELFNDLSYGYGLGASLAWTSANVLGPLIGAWWLRRSNADRLDAVRAIAALVLVAVVASLLAGVVGALGTVYRGSVYSYPVILGKWAIGDGLGVLTITPSVVWLRDRRAREELLRPEAIVLAACVAAVTTMIFSFGDMAWDPVLPYLVLPPLVWAAVRFRVAGAAVTSFLASMIANSATAVGWGPFTYTGLNDDVAVVMLQLFLATITVTALLLGARTSEAAAHARDLEEQTRRARAGESTAELYRRVLDEAPAAVFVKDAQGRYLLANLATANLFGRSRGAVLGRTDRELLPEIADRFAAAEEEVRRSGVRVETDDVMPTEEGPRTLFTVRFPVIDPGSGDALVAGIATDVSERRALEQRLAMAERLETVGELAGGIAHDFNNLLIVIGGMTQLALNELAGHPAAEPLREVLIANERASRLGRQLLTFARREPSGSDGRCVADEVVAHLEGLLQPLLPEHTDLGFVLEAGDAMVPLPADRLEQVLLNLAVNARDAMPDGGALTICTERTEVHTPLAHTLPPVQPGSYLLVTVTDTGDGMAPGVREHAIEPFFTTKPPGQGTGLGLASVYGSVTSVGGSIDLESRPGTGTAVRMWLPMVPEEVSATATAPDADDPAPADGQTILVVEDDPTVRELLSRQLRTLGYVVHEASCLAEVVELIDGIGDLDLLVCDVVLTDGAGPEVAEVLRLHQPSLPVLYISGYTERTWTGHGRLVSDEERLLRKPFTAVALQRAVAASLSRTQSSIDG